MVPWGGTLRLSASRCGWWQTLFTPAIIGLHDTADAEQIVLPTGDNGMTDDGNSSTSGPALAGRMRAGDNEAANAVVEWFGPWLRRAVDRKIGARLRRRVDADDILQSAFWSFIWRTSDGQYNFDHTGALCQMLLRIAENKIRKAAERHTRECRDFRQEVYIDFDTVAHELTDGEWERTARDVADVIDVAAEVIDRLEPRDAEFFRRRYILGESASQISIETGWSLTTVKRVLKGSVDEIRDLVQNDS